MYARLYFLPCCQGGGGLVDKMRVAKLVLMSRQRKLFFLTCRKSSNVIRILALESEMKRWRKACWKRNVILYFLRCEFV